MNKKKVDVVIPVYHPGSEFKKLMERLERQTYEVNSIFLMHTTDGQSLESMKERYKNVTVEEITPDEFDHAATRDKGIRQSDADIVICMTQDACPDNEYLVSELVQALEEANVAVAYARQLPRKESTLLERYTRQFNYPPESKVKSSKDLEKMGIKTFFCSDVCAAYNRDMYLKNGGFEKKAIFNEDMIFAGKRILAGDKVAYVAEAKVIHSHNYTGNQQFHRNFDLAVSQAQHPEVFEGVPSEGEGIRMVKATAKYLIRSGQPLEILNLIYQSGCKYMGYFLGKRYEKLPKWLVLKCTSSPKYWKKS